jgi:hypothetical protein
VRWENQNLHAYQYVAERLCFCVPEGEVFVTVWADQVTSVRAATGAPLSTAGWYTVDQLFDLAQHSFNEKGKRVFVDYDPRLGYPTLLHVTCTEVSDCGVSIQVKSLGPILPTPLAD